MNSTKPNHLGIERQPFTDRILGLLDRGLESYRPVDHFGSVAEIGSEHILGLINDGRSIFISDIDGTVTPNGSFDISEQTRETYMTITSHPGAKLYLWTNITAKTEDELVRLQYIAETLDTGLVTYKDAPDETKPSPAKIHAIMAHANARRDDGQPELTTANVVMIGDKLTADVRAGNFTRDIATGKAEVHTIFVDRLGPASTDLVGDRLLRRPTEKLLWFFMQLTDGAGDKRSVQMVDITGPHKTFVREKQLRRVPPKLTDEIAARSRIANVGSGDDLVVPAEAFATLPPPRTESLHAMRRKVNHSRLMQAFEARAEQHGKKDANIITATRFVGIPFVVGAIVFRKPRLAAALYGVLSAGDSIDGLESKIYFKAHPEEKMRTGTKPHAVKDRPKNKWFDRNLSLTKNIRRAYKQLMLDMEHPDWGAEYDPKADKFLANSTEIALTASNPSLAPYVGAIIVRDVARERVQRPHFEKKGFNAMDVRATTSSKASSFVLNIAIVTSLLSKNRNVRRSAHAVAAGVKIFSYFASECEWKRRKQFREDAASAKANLLSTYSDSLSA